MRLPALCLRAAAVLMPACAFAAPVSDSFVSSGQASLGLAVQSAVRSSVHAHLLDATLPARTQPAGLWADLRFGETENDHLHAGTGSEGHWNAFTVGADIRRGDSLFGTAWTWASGRSETRGEPVRRQGDADYLGLRLYGAQGFGNLFFTGQAGYTLTRSDSDGTTPSQNTRSHFFTMDAGAHLNLEIGERLTVQPYGGVQGTWILWDGNTQGSDIPDAHVFEAPAGVRLTAAFDAMGWTVRPSADLSVTMSFGDEDLEVSVPGEAAQRVAFVNGTVWRSELGVEASRDNARMALLWRWGASDEGRRDGELTLSGSYEF